MRGENNSLVWGDNVFSLSSACFCTGDHAGHPSHLHDPHEEQENMHAGDYFSHVEVLILVFISSETIIAAWLLCTLCPKICIYCCPKFQMV